jgi:hypothetical protein
MAEYSASSVLFVLELAALRFPSLAEVLIYISLDIILFLDEEVKESRNLP